MLILVEGQGKVKEVKKVKVSVMNLSEQHVQGYYIIMLR